MLPKRALQLQDQLESIEKAANAYFDVGDPSLADEKRRAEIDQDLASFVNRMFDVIEPSSRFGELDEATLRNELSRAQVALRFRRLRRWNTFVEHDEGRFLAVVEAGQAEDPIDLSDSREEFDKGLETIGRILIRIPDQTHGEIREASSKQQAREPNVTIFPSPSDLHWEEVSMAFVSDEVIKVKARGQLVEYRFDQIGFENKRSGKANILWWVLRGLAMNNGRASWEDLNEPTAGSFDLGDRNKLEAKVKRLRKTLREFMGIEGDPFYPYRREQAYQTKLTLTNDAPALIDSANDAPESGWEAVFNQEVNRLP